MSRNERSEKTKRSPLLETIALVVIICLVMAVIFLLTGQTETTIVKTTKDPEVSYLVCKTDKKLEDAFFTNDSEVKETYEVKATFEDDKAKKLFFTYRGTYETDSEAEAVMTRFSIDYGKYMAQYDKQSKKDISSNFKRTGKEVLATLFMDADKLNSYNSKLFFIDADVFNTAKTYDVYKMEKLYKEKGFACKIDK